MTQKSEQPSWLRLSRLTPTLQQRWQQKQPASSNSSQTGLPREEVDEQLKLDESATSK